MVIFGIVLSIFTLIFPQNITAQTLHNQTIEEITKQKVVLDRTPQIDIGGRLRYMHIDLAAGIIYVSRPDSNAISVISTGSNTKIGDIEVGQEPNVIKTFYVPGNNNDGGRRVVVANERLSGNVSVISTENYTKIKDIEVGKEPGNIEMGSIYNETSGRRPDIIYVANTGSGTVSVISVNNDTKIKDIEVGGWPKDIETGSIYIETSGRITDKIYVSNTAGTVSVISVNNDTKIKDIKVGKAPRDVRFDEDSNTIYVSNTGSEGISVIDGKTDKVVARVTFAVNPSNAGEIICNGITSPVNRYFYVSAGTECVAMPNKGFEFISWVENVGGNSTRTLKSSADTTFIELFLDFFNIKLYDPTTTSILELFLDFFNIKLYDSTTTLNDIQFGNFAANFNKLPAPIPSEYLIPLYGIIVTTIVGWSIPSIIGWIRAGMDSRRMNYYHMKIASLYNDGKLDENDINSLNQIRNDVSDAYSKGQIGELHYESLKNEISMLYDEIFKRRFNFLNSLEGKDKIQKLDEIKNDIEDAYSKGKIGELHYELLNKKIQDIQKGINESV